MIVKSQVVAHHHDVVSSKSICRLDPERGEARTWVGLQKCVSEDVTPAARKEDPLRQCPSANWSQLHSGGKNIHRGKPPIDRVRIFDSAAVGTNSPFAALQRVRPLCGAVLPCS